MSAHARKPGDLYRRSGGPKVDVEFVKSPPLASRFCAEYRLTTDEAGVVKDNVSPVMWEACKQGVIQARKVANDFAGARGLEDGYLRGYAWGLRKGVRIGKRDRAARDRAQTSAFESPQLVKAIEEAKNRGDQLGRTDGEQQIKDRFENAFEKQIMPETKYNQKTVKVPTPEMLKDPHQSFYGKLATDAQIVKEQAESSYLTIPGAANRLYFAGKKYPVLDSFKEKGVHPFDWKDATNVERGWKHWQGTAKSEDLQWYAGLRGAPKELYEKTFRNAYKEYAEYGYSSRFHRAIDVGVKAGYSLGKKVGSQYRYLHSFRDAINNTYNEKVPDEFQKAYLASYKEAFEAYVASREAAPILSITEVTLTEGDPDGIIAPGEGLRVVVKVENRGLKSATLPVEVQGPVADIQPTWLEVPAFKRKTLTTKSIAKVEPTTKVGSTVDFQIAVENRSYPAKKQIRQILEVDRVVLTEVDPLAGAGTVKATLVNPTNKPSAKGSTVKLLVDDGTRATLAAPIIPAGEKKTLTLSFKQVDPLSLISGTTSDVLLYRGETRLHGGAATVQSEEPKQMLMNYFDQLAYGEGFLPENIVLVDQVTKAMEALVARGRNEVASAKGNPWQDDPLETVLGRVAEQYETASGEAKDRYKKLGTDLCSLNDLLPKLDRKRRASYDSLCRRINKNYDELDEVDIDELTSEDGKDPVAKP